MFDDEKGVIDSFLPPITFSVRKGDTFATKFARLACLGLMIYVTYSIVKEPKMITSFSDASFKGISEVLEWGQLKLAGNVTEEIIPEEKKSLEDIEKEFKDKASKDSANPNQETNDEQNTGSENAGGYSDSYGDDDDKI